VLFQVRQAGRNDCLSNHQKTSYLKPIPNKG
jgi:hypothetical protein